MKTSITALGVVVSTILGAFSVSASADQPVPADFEAPADCTGTLVAVYGFSPGVGAVSFTPANMPPGVQSVTASFQLAGAPVAGSTSFETCVDCMASLNENNGSAFMAQKKTRDGSASMTLSSASRVFATPDGSVYTVHGSIDAEMPASHADDRGAVVRMHVQF
jgi:hypothetical protein